MFPDTTPEDRRESGRTDASRDETTVTISGSRDENPSQPPVSQTPKKPRAKRSIFYPRGSMIPPHVLATISRAGVIPYCIASTRALPLSNGALGDSWRREGFSELSLPEGKTFMQGVSINETAQAEINCAAAESALWFAVAIDAQFGELTDCGGRRKTCESVETTASRELYEESVRIFEMIYDTDIVRDSPAIVGEGVCVYFVRVTPYGFGFPDRLAPIFSSIRKHIVGVDPAMMASNSAAQRSASMVENSLMYWIPGDDFAKLAKTRAMRQAKPPADPFIDGSSSIQRNATGARARSALPSRTKASKVSVPAWMPRTCAAIRDLCSDDALANDGEAPKHPIMYEILRRIVSPNIDELISTLSGSS